MQIAKARGAYVIATASARKHDFVRQLGADQIIDYQAVDFTKATGDLDVVLELVVVTTAGARSKCCGPAGY